MYLLKFASSGRWRVAALACLCLVLLAFPAEAARKVRLRLLWVHQAQFAGYYLAQNKGLYAAKGLEVEIIPGGPGIIPLDDLTSGEVDFAVGWLAAGMEARSKGQPIFHLAQVTQQSGMILVAFADSGIRTVADLHGKRVGLWDNYLALAPQALFQNAGIRVRSIHQSLTMSAFLNRAVDAASAMTYNEYHRLYQFGVNWDELVVIDLAKQGLNFPEDALFCREDAWKDRPEVCRAFVEASLEGLRLAFDDPSLALDSVMRRINEANLASNRSHQSWMLDRLRDLVIPADKSRSMGCLDPRDYERVEGELLRNGLTYSPLPREDWVREAWRREK